MGSSPTTTYEAFTVIQAAMNVVRHEELWRLYGELDRLADDTAERNWRHKHLDRDLNNEETWALALEYAKELIDDRLTALRGDY